MIIKKTYYNKLSHIINSFNNYKKEFFNFKIFRKNKLLLLLKIFLFFQSMIQFIRNYFINSKQKEILFGIKSKKV
jgi:hypothetical protein